METNLLVLSIVLTVSFGFSQLFKRYKYPEVVAQILAGIFFSIPFLKSLFFSDTSVISLFSEIGIIFLLLLTGMEINYRELLKEKKQIFLVALFSFIVPFAFGYFSMRLLGYSRDVSIIIGFALSLTAEGTKLKVLMDHGLLKTWLGEIMIGAGIADDIFEIMGMSFVLFFSLKQNIKNWVIFPIQIILFSIITFLILKYFPKLLSKIKESSDEVEDFTLVVILGLITTFFSTLLNLGTVIGAFIGGIIIHKLFSSKKDEKDILKDLKVLTFGFIVPFFFVNIGLQFDFGYLKTNLFLLFVVLLAAILGKIIGAVLVSFFTDITLKQSILLGWAMNSRGAVELIIIGIANSLGIMPKELFSSVVIMTIITTSLFPIILNNFRFKKSFFEKQS